MTIEALGGNLRDKENGASVQPKNQLGELDILDIKQSNKIGDLRRLLWIPNHFRRRINIDRALIMEGRGNDLVPPTPTVNGEDEEHLFNESHKITDVLYNLDGRGPIPLTQPNIMQTMDWAQHPWVKGHVYGMETSPKRPDLDIFSNFLLYYHGAINDEGDEKRKEDSIFFKAVNRNDVTEKMLANCRAFLKGATYRGENFIKRGRTAYLERLIVGPEVQDKGVGTAFMIEILDTLFYRSEFYDGKPADEVRLSIFTDKEASSAAGEGRIGYDRNDYFFRQFGFEPDYANTDGGTIPIGNRKIQPYKLNVERYEQYRAKALETLTEKQPERKLVLEEVWDELKEILRKKDPNYAKNR